MPTFMMIQDFTAMTQLQKGQNLATQTFGPVQQVDMVRYAGASGDFNPIHNDIPFAQATGLKKTIVFGMYTMALMGRVVESFLPRKVIRKFAAKFKDIIYVNDSIECTAIVKKINSETGQLTILLTASVDNKVKASAEIEAHYIK